VLCEDLADARDATEIAHRILETFDVPFICSKHEAYVSASIGIAFSTNGTETAEAILQSADAAMYRAKDGGRARFEVFDDSMRHGIASRLELESALRHAITRDELRVFYQPVVASGTGTVMSFEALVRWERPGFGLVSPGAFIAVAEETGMILEIGAWVLQNACQQATRWAALWPERRLGVAVNISSRQVLKGNIVELVRRTLRVSGLDPTLLTLELTETTLIDDAMSAGAILRALRDLGVNIALDDFGTGYSSLTYLRAFPINVIKIDESFVRTIGTEREGAAIVAAVVSLAKSLNMRVVAEGIETLDQLAAVVHLNCEMAQGYLFSHPKPIDEIQNLVEESPSWLMSTSNSAVME
jgi:EAL domain-containing protein (putative c-di-GMP-specific phosphodiesterase class I)